MAGAKVAMTERTTVQQRDSMMDHLKDIMMAETMVALKVIPRKQQRDLLTEHMNDIMMA